MLNKGTDLFFIDGSTVFLPPAALGLLREDYGYHYYTII